MAAGSVMSEPSIGTTAIRPISSEPSPSSVKPISRAAQIAIGSGLSSTARQLTSTALNTPTG